MASRPPAGCRRYNLIVGVFVALLPLFPLDVVLLPGTPLPLHIFEPRYKEMIAECLANHAPFGVVRALEEGVSEVGCTAEIVTVTKEYPDGRMDLIAEGRQRFEVLELNRETELAQSKLIWKFYPWLEPYKTCRQPIQARSPFISRARCRSISTSSRNC
jgi:Lon protease-like protein